MNRATPTAPIPRSVAASDRTQGPTGTRHKYGDERDDRDHTRGLQPARVGHYRLVRSTSSGLTLIVQESGTDWGVKHSLSSHAW